LLGQLVQLAGAGAAVCDVPGSGAVADAVNGS
jgi:hypothetical protein